MKIPLSKIYLSLWRINPFLLELRLEVIPELGEVFRRDLAHVIPTRGVLREQLVQVLVRNLPLVNPVMTQQVDQAGEH